MSDWTAGYVADIGYTYGYYPETMPMRLRWASLIQAHDAPASGFRGNRGQTPVFPSDSSHCLRVVA